MTAILNEPIPTLADAWARLSGVPLERILFEPAPGTAAEEDVVRLHDHDNRLFELVDGVLVEKPMRFLESRIAMKIGQLLENYVEEHDLGIVAGADGMVRLARGLVRIPDVSVVLWNRLPGRRIPTEPIPSLAPDLAVEVLSASNTAAEMERKISEYFLAGCQCVWLIDPAVISARNYTSPTDFVLLTGNGLLTAEDVLPGFSVAIADLFRRAGIA